MKSTRIWIVVGLWALLGGCGNDRAKEAQQDVVAVGRLAVSRSGGGNSREATEFYRHRAAAGDTIPMSARDLCAFLPDTIPGYAPEGNIDTASGSDDGYLTTIVRRTWALCDTIRKSPAKLTVTLGDTGGGAVAYARIEPVISESPADGDDVRHVAVVKLDVPYTYGVQSHDKQKRVQRLILCTRYRYLITIESKETTSAGIAMLTGLASSIAREFKGK